MTAEPLAGLKVLDLTSGSAGGMATMILADYGAAVSRITDPQYQYLNQVPCARMWMRGKAACTDLDACLRSADIVITTLPNGFLFPGEDQPLREQQVLSVNPQVIYCEISCLGTPDGPPLSEGLAAAVAGRMKSMEGIIRKAGPNFAAVPVASHATSQNIVSGVLAAVYKRRNSGAGSVIRTSLLHGLIPYDQGPSLAMQINPHLPQIDPVNIMPTLNYHPVQCADGKWLQLGNLLPHLFQHFMTAIGLAHLIAGLPDEIEQVRDQILTTMQTRTSSEWMEVFVNDGSIAAHAYQSAADALHDPDMTLNNHVATLDGVRQLGPLANLTKTPARITFEAKQDQGFDWSQSADRDALRPPSEQAGQLQPGPLSGVVVLELATIIAAPLGASFLADLGARVIKVEAIGGDPYRHMAGGIGAIRCNQGKESISVDLKTPQGQLIVQQLADKADILIHNFRPGVPERLGISYEHLCKTNPGLIHISANGYGPGGPGALRPSTHPIPGAAMGGAGHQAGGLPESLLDLPGLRETARRLMRANEVNPDPNTALVISATSLLALLARERSGHGQQVFVDMFIANAYANFDDMLEYSGKPQRPGLGPSLNGPQPLYRLYQTSAGWIFLGLQTPGEWQGFCRLSEPELVNKFGLNPGDDPELDSALETLFLTKSAIQWQTQFAGTGVPLVTADHDNLPGFFYRQCSPDSTLMSQVHHRQIGPYYRHNPMLQFSATQSNLRGGVIAGEHGVTLLTELGYQQEEISLLFDNGILWEST